MVYGTRIQRTARRHGDDVVAFRAVFAARVLEHADVARPQITDPRRCAARRSRRCTACDPSGSAAFFAPFGMKTSVFSFTPSRIGIISARLTKSRSSSRTLKSFGTSPTATSMSDGEDRRTASERSTRVPNRSNGKHGKQLIFIGADCRQRASERLTNRSNGRHKPGYSLRTGLQQQCSLMDRARAIR